MNANLNSQVYDLVVSNTTIKVARVPDFDNIVNVDMNHLPIILKFQYSDSLDSSKNTR